MDKLASSVFRRYFAKLDAPTIVTVNGHAIGTWHPAGPYMVEAAKLDGEPEPYVIAPFASKPHTPERRTEIANRHVPREFRTPKERQASRDAILRKINRGG